MIFTSFSVFNYDKLKEYSDILADPLIKLERSNSYGIIIRTLPAQPKWEDQILSYSGINELYGQCGVAVLSSIPTERDLFGKVLVVAEELCRAFGYNTLMISTNYEEWVDMYEEFGFKRVWSNKNLHTTLTITILCKSMENK